MNVLYLALAVWSFASIPTFTFFISAVVTWSAVVGIRDSLSLISPQFSNVPLFTTAPYALRLVIEDSSSSIFPLLITLSPASLVFTNTPAIPLTVPLVAAKLGSPTRLSWLVWSPLLENLISM